MVTAEARDPQLIPVNQQLLKLNKEQMERVSQIPLCSQLLSEFWPINTKSHIIGSVTGNVALKEGRYLLKMSLERSSHLLSF